MNDKTMSMMTALPPEYDGIPSSDYDPSFMVDISNKMRVPEKIGAVTYDDKMGARFDDINRTASMNVPEKIVVVGGQEQSKGMRQDPNLHLDMASFPSQFDAMPLSLSTPPRSLKLNEVSFLEHTEKAKLDPAEAAFMASDDRQTQNGYINKTPIRHNDGLHHQALMATPGDHLLISDQEDDFSVLKKQVAKLSYHVVKLEEDNASRRQRELVLYPLMFGYLFMQIAKWFLSNK